MGTLAWIIGIRLILIEMCNYVIPWMVKEFTSSSWVERQEHIW